LIVAVAVPAGWGRRRTVLLVLVLTAGTSLIVNAIKLLIGRPRPTLEEVLATATGYAFPSGHSAQAVVAYATLAYLLTRRWRRRSVAVVAWTTAAVVALVVGFSRMYLGVHWMTDVIGGYLLAAVWMVTVLTVVHTVATVRGRSETRRRGAPAAR
jgi:undecaprenyl-diphosphatase